MKAPSGRISGHHSNPVATPSAAPIAAAPGDSSPGSGKAPVLELAATLFTLEQLRAATPDSPQIAMAGRSNVGKSSLLNALARRRQLAKTSATPGKTRSVNLFRVLLPGGPSDETAAAFYLTDLPGYGYARRGKEERKFWGSLLETYLLQTSQLKGLLLLLDCRLPPQESDRLMADFARAHNLPVAAVLTKADKCTQRERAARQKEWATILRGKAPLLVSAKTGLGLPALWDVLKAMALPGGTSETAGETPSQTPGKAADTIASSGQPGSSAD